MMIVVVIVGVVAAIAVPNLSPLVKRQRLKGKAEAVASVLDRGRRLAYAHGRCTQVTSTGSALELEKPDPTVASSQGNDCTQLNGSGVAATSLSNMNWKRVQRLPADGTLTFNLDDTNGLTEIIFRPSGRLRGDGDLATTDDGARIDVNYPELGEGWLVKVTPAGRICKQSYFGAAPAQSAPETCP
jgi:Tfp pilus assembly protein FimT